MHIITGYIPHNQPFDWIIDSENRLYNIKGSLPLSTIIFYSMAKKGETDP